MTEKLKHIIKDEVLKLPKENQEVINSFGWEQISQEVGNKYLLSESEINDFQTEVLLVLIGLEDPSLFPNHLENNIGTSKKEANKISEEVFQKIFIPITDVLVEKIKESENTKNPNFNQTLNFILSGGNYASFIVEREMKELPISMDVKKNDIQDNLEKTLGIKDKFVI